MDPPLDYRDYEDTIEEKAEGAIKEEIEEEIIKEKEEELD